jgi:hypothetical protein
VGLFLAQKMAEDYLLANQAFGPTDNVVLEKWSELNLLEGHKKVRKLPS